jgi:Domain of unknown function (DUF4281)
MKTLSLYFKIATYLACLGWAILLFLPNWDHANFLIKSVVVVLLSMLYIYLLFFRKNIPGEIYPKGGFTTLKGVMNLFTNPKGVLAGWVHYLAFDLLVGVYIKTEAQSIGMSHWWQIPCFLLAFMFGPAGYLLFFILSFIVV